jgi:Lon protease-like protein
MSDDLDDFRGTARLFPLPNLVLFPHVVQPLHIFEPRYRQLMADTLADNRLMALALLRPGWEEDYDKRPPIFPVVCLGKVHKEERLPDGRYNLLLHGLSRARVLEELPDDKLYRTARVELLRDSSQPTGPDEQQVRDRLGERVRAWYASQSTALEQVGKLLESNLPIGTLCDIFGFALPLELELKQRLLEQSDVRRRAGLLLEHLQSHSPPEALPMPQERKFPPEFSTN